MDNPNDVGQILKAERERLGLTLDVIQEATKIPIDSLKAIEEGYKIRTLTAFYYKSFVRLYAQHLGLDPAPILAKIPTYQAVRKFSAAESSGLVKSPDLSKFNITAGQITPPSWKKYVPVVLTMVMVVLAAWGVFAMTKFVAAKLSAAAAQKQNLPLTREAIRNERAVPLKTGKTVKTEKAVQSLPPAASERPEIAVKVEKTVKPVAAETVSPAVQAAAPQPQAEHAKTAPAAPNTAAEVKAIRKVSMTVRAAVTAWLTVKCDGSVVFKGSLKKGTAETWTAVNRIELSGKEIDQLEYEINGKTIGKLSRRDTNARRVIITPDGLSVEK